jgi:hypothetical protein
MPARIRHRSDVTEFAIQGFKVDVTITAARCTRPYRSRAGISLYSGVATRHNDRQSVRYKPVGLRAAAVAADGSGTETQLASCFEDI